MLRLADPAEAYRRVELDACVAGSSSSDLVLLCIDHVRCALSQALWAERHGRRDGANKSLARARSGLVALRLGVDSASPLAGQLLTLYGAMETSITASQFRFNRPAMERVVADLDDISSVYRMNRAG
ncbi:MAG: flagellar protein FliS [Erythrobacter sp.]|nr:MAG: flagellar protein FliS [Erythrobacter sp.]